MAQQKIEILVPCQIVKQAEAIGYKAMAKAVAEIVGPNNAITTPTKQPDLLFMRSILVSTGENQNDDVFLPDEMWRARSTPILKPVDWEHNTGRELTPQEQAQNPGKVIVDNQTIGVMYNAYAIDEHGALIDETKVSASDFQIPTKFHIVDEAVIWKALYPNVAKSVEAGASNGTLFVSMEAWFTDYRYLVGDKVVSRNEETAFLDGSLKANGGTGSYGNTRVRRVLRDLTFGGKGIVARPANEPSIITHVSHQPLEATSASTNQAIAKNIICDIRDMNTVPPRRESEMTQETNQNKQVSLELYTKANEENVDLRAAAKATEAELTKTQAEVVDLKAKIEDITSAFAKGAETLELGSSGPEDFFTALADKLAENKKVQAELTKELEAANATIAETKLNARTAAREAKIRTLLGMAAFVPFKKKGEEDEDEDKSKDKKKKEAKAAKMMAAVKDLSDEQFDALYEVWAEQQAEVVASQTPETPKSPETPAASAGADDANKALQTVFASLLGGKNDAATPTATPDSLLEVVKAKLAEFGCDVDNSDEIAKAMAGHQEISDDDNLALLLKGVKASEQTPPAGAEAPQGIDLTQSFSGLVNKMLGREEDK